MNDLKREYRKAYYLKNRERILNYMNEKNNKILIHCKCGKIVSHNHLSKHLLSLYHLDFEDKEERLLKEIN